MKLPLALLASLLFGILTEPLLATNPLLLLRRQQGRITQAQMERQLRQKFHTLLQDSSFDASKKLQSQYDTWIYLVWQEHEAQWRMQFRNLVEEKSLARLHQNIRRQEHRLLDPATLYVAGYRTFYYRWMLLSTLALESWGAKHGYGEVAWAKAFNALTVHDLLTATKDTLISTQMYDLLIPIRKEAKRILETRWLAMPKKQRKTFTPLNTLEVLGKSLAISQIEVFQHEAFEIIYTYLETHDEMQGHTVASVRDPILRVCSDCSAEGQPWMKGYFLPMEQAILDVIQELDPSLAL